jgi:hypothetical protein
MSCSYGRFCLCIESVLQEKLLVQPVVVCLLVYVLFPAAEWRSFLLSRCDLLGEFGTWCLFHQFPLIPQWNSPVELLLDSLVEVVTVSSVELLVWQVLLVRFVFLSSVFLCSRLFSLTGLFDDPSLRDFVWFPGISDSPAESLLLSILDLQQIGYSPSEFLAFSLEM